MPKFGSVPAAASANSRESSTSFEWWGPYRQSANEGQMLHPYAWNARDGAYMRHDRPACWSRSMIVGTHRTGEGRYGPEPFGFGTHDGTHSQVARPSPRHRASRKLSHPHPGPGAPRAERTGVLPSNPSSRAA